MGVDFDGMLTISFWQNLPFQKVVHQVATFDAQPSSDAGGILVMVTGALLVSYFRQYFIHIASCCFFLFSL